MPVNDELSEVLLVQQEVLPDPQQVFILLLIERDAGPHAGMHEKEIAAGERTRHPVDQPEVLLRNRARKFARQFAPLLGAGLGGRFQSVGLQRLQSAELAPMGKQVGTGGEVAKQGFMIALEQQDLLMARARDQAVEHVAAGGPAIDIVAEKNLHRVRRRMPGPVGIDPRQHVDECVVHAVDVRDGVDAQPVGQAGRRFAMGLQDRHGLAPGSGLAGFSRLARAANHAALQKRKQKPRRKRRGFLQCGPELTDDGRVVARGDDLLGRLHDRAMSLQVMVGDEARGAGKNANRHHEDRRDQRNNNDLDMGATVGGLERSVVHNHSP